MMIDRLRKWIFRLFFGIKLEDFILGNVRASIIREDVKQMQQAWADVLVELLALQDALTNMQKAMILMNDSMAKMSETDQHHQEAIQQLTRLGQIHNQNFHEILKKFKQGSEEETLFAASDKTGKLN